MEKVPASIQNQLRRPLLKHLQTWPEILGQLTQHQAQDFYLYPMCPLCLAQPPSVEALGSPGWVQHQVRGSLLAMLLLLAGYSLAKSLSLAQRNHPCLYHPDAGRSLVRLSKMNSDQLMKLLPVAEGEVQVKS